MKSHPVIVIPTMTPDPEVDSPPLTPTSSKGRKKLSERSFLLHRKTRSKSASHTNQPHTHRRATIHCSHVGYKDGHGQGQGHSPLTLCPGKVPTCPEPAPVTKTKSLSRGVRSALSTGSQELAKSVDTSLSDLLHPGGNDPETESNDIILSRDLLRELTLVPPRTVEVAFHGGQGEGFQPVLGPSISRQLEDYVDEVRERRQDAEEADVNPRPRTCSPRAAGMSRVDLYHIQHQPTLPGWQLGHVTPPHVTGSACHRNSQKEVPLSYSPKLAICRRSQSCDPNVSRTRARAQSSPQRHAHTEWSESRMSMSSVYRMSRAKLITPKYQVVHSLEDFQALRPTVLHFNRAEGGLHKPGEWRVPRPLVGQWVGGVSGHSKTITDRCHGPQSPTGWGRGGRGGGDGGSSGVEAREGVGSKQVRRSHPGDWGSLASVVSDSSSTLTTASSGSLRVRHSIC